MNSNNRRVVLCCPGERRSRFQATALYEHRLLEFWFKGIHREKYYYLKYFINAESVKTNISNSIIYQNFLFEILFKLTSRLNFLNKYRGIIHELRNKTFGNNVVKNLDIDPLHPRIIYSYSSGCGETSLFLSNLRKNDGDIYIIEHCSAPKNFEHDTLLLENDKWGRDSIDNKINNELFLIADQNIELAFADYHVVGSDFVANKLLGYGVEESKIIKLKKPCFIKPHLELKNNSFFYTPIIKFLIIGEVSLLKGSPYLLSIVSQFEGICEFYFAGKVSLPSKLIPDVNNIHFLGHISREKIRTMSSEIHMGIHVSLSEDNPMAVLELLSLGIPCIVGPASAESVTDGVNGIVLNHVSSENINSAINKVIMDKDFLKQLFTNLSLERDFYVSEEEYKRNYLSILKSVQ